MKTSRALLRARSARHSRLRQGSSPFFYVRRIASRDAVFAPTAVKSGPGVPGFKRLLSVMPEGREEKAKELGAFTRGRAIKSAHDLLRLAFLCLAEGKSFGGTAASPELGDICPISEKGALTRFQKRDGVRRPRRYMCPSYALFLCL
jgi:hypothetical protein